MARLSLPTLRARVHRLDRLERKRVFEGVLALVLLADAAVLSVEVEMSLDDDDTDVYTAMRVSTPFFGLIYLSEMLMKLRRLGLASYATSPSHGFDGLVTLVTVGADVLVIGPLFAHAIALRIALALRTSRLLRLFTTVHRFRVIFRRVVRLLPELTGLFGALWALFSVYAELGVLVFGGTFYLGDAYEKAHPGTLYTYCNFNDFGSAMVTLFELLLVNNWMVIMDEAVVATNQWARVYFMSWWVAAVLVMFNLLIAFFLQEMTTPLEPTSLSGASKAAGVADGPQACPQAGDSDE